MAHGQEIDPTTVIGELPDAENYTPEPAEEDLVGDLKRFLNAAEDNRTRHEYDWQYSKYMERGDQIVVQNEVTGEVLRLGVVPDEENKLLSIENLFRPISRALLGKLTRVTPAMTVTPATSDNDEVRAANIAESYFDYFQRVDESEIKFLEVNRKLITYGTGVMETVWDRNKGRTMSWCAKCKMTGSKMEIGNPCQRCAMEQEMAAQQQMGMGMEAPQQTSVMKEISEGDVSCLLHSTEDFYPEPGIEDVRDMRKCCIVKTLPVSKVRRMFPENGRFVSEETNLYRDRALVSHNGAFTQEETDYLNEHVRLHKFLLAPDELYPEGRTIYMANDIILKIEETSHYNDLGRLPVFIYRFTKQHGSVWGEGYITQAGNIQRERNDLLQQMRQQRALTNNPQKLVPLASKISQSEWDTQPGRLIKYNHMAGKPTFVETPPFANYTYNELQRMEIAMQKQAGVTEQEMGASSNEQSGRYAAMMEAQSMESVSPILKAVKHEWRAMMRSVLILAQKYYHPDRIVTISGSDRVRSFQWSEANLKQGWDLDFGEEDALSKNDALRLEQSMQLLQANAFTDPATGAPDLRAFKKTAGLKLSAVGPDFEGSDRSYAASIPDRIIRGEEWQPMPFDNAKICAEELLGWLKGEGRSYPMPTRDTVMKAWMFYVSIMQPQTVDDMRVMPNGMAMPAQPQQPQAGPNMGMGQGQMPQQGGQGAPTAMQDAARNVHQADVTAEGAARAGAHEG